MRNIVLLLLVVLLISCGPEEKASNVKDISLTTEDMINGIDDELQEEIADYAFLDADPEKFYNRMWAPAYQVVDNDTLGLSEIPTAGLNGEFYIVTQENTWRIDRKGDSIKLCTESCWLTLNDSTTCYLCGNSVLTPLWSVDGVIAKTNGFQFNNSDSLQYNHGAGTVHMIDMGFDLPTIQSIISLLPGDQRSIVVHKSTHAVFESPGFTE